MENTEKALKYFELVKASQKKYAQFVENFHFGFFQKVGSLAEELAKEAKGKKRGQSP
jgi:hypothetical protein